MEIPIGKDYTFTIEVMGEDSDTPLNVTTYTATFNIFDKSTNNTIITTTLYPVAARELDGIMQGTIPAADTQGIAVAQGSAVDDYYVKTRHGGFIHISNGSAVDKNVIVDEVVFIPTGY